MVLIRSSWIDFKIIRKSSSRKTRLNWNLGYEDIEEIWKRNQTTDWTSRTIIKWTRKKIGKRKEKRDKVTKCLNVGVKLKIHRRDKITIRLELRRFTIDVIQVQIRDRYYLKRPLI